VWLFAAKRCLTSIGQAEMENNTGLSGPHSSEWVYYQQKAYRLTDVGCFYGNYPLKAFCFGLYLFMHPSVCDHALKSLWTQRLTNRFCEFHTFGAVGDRGELIGFWGQKVKGQEHSNTIYIWRLCIQTWLSQTTFQMVA